MQQAQLGMFFAAMLACAAASSRGDRSKKYQLCLQQCQANISPAVSLSKKRGAVTGRAVAYQSLKKLGRLYDHLLARNGGAADCAEHRQAAGAVAQGLTTSSRPREPIVRGDSVKVTWINLLCRLRDRR